ncbi:MAG: hypothetical protein C4533_01785 [Candidatus Omnitrophota bacterium]|nr:MAG: hypothetical protein C4533_01785 [Candidatus Omnitrophota bacterium]
MKYKEQSLAVYLNDLSARLAAPGGGSAAALSASLGAALVSMVINFTIGKKKYAGYEKELAVLLDKSEKLKFQLLDMVDLDVAAYASKNLRDALDVPFMVCRLSFEAAKLCPPLVKKGNINLISDVGVAIALLEAAFFSALLNVEINLKSLADAKLASSIRKELDKKAKDIKKIRAKTEAQVVKAIRG